MDEKLGDLTECRFSIEPPGRGKYVVRVSGPAKLIESLLDIGSSKSQYDYNYNARERLFPIFIPTRGREIKGQLNLQLPNALGSPTEGQPIKLVVYVVIPSEETQYRERWEQSLLLVLPREAEVLGVSYARWMVQMMVTYGSSLDSSSAKAAWSLRYLWLLDDQMSEFFKLVELSQSEVIELNKFNGNKCQTVLKRKIVRNSFLKALLFLQQSLRRDSVRPVLSGFLRDDGLCTTKAAPWGDDVLTCYKAVLLDIHSLKLAQVV